MTCIAGASTASLAELSYRLHADLAREHDGASRWGYRQLTTLSVSASTGKRSAAAPRKTPRNKHADLTDWMDGASISHTSQLGDSSTTAQVHPQLFTRAMADMAREQGAEIKMGTLTHVDPHGAGYVATVSKADGSKYEIGGVSDIVIAAGPWTGALLKHAFSPEIKLAQTRARSIRGSRAHSVVVRPPSGLTLPPAAYFMSLAGEGEPEIYLRPDNTAYACGPSDSSPLPLHARDVQSMPTSTREILSQVARLSPSHMDPDKGATVEKEQACYLPVGSGDPVLARLAQGVFVASGHSCWGICNGPGTGLCMAEFVLDGHVSSADISYLDS